MIRPVCDLPWVTRALLAATLAGATLPAQDWPQRRGAERLWIRTETGVPRAFDEGRSSMRGRRWPVARSRRSLELVEGGEVESAGVEGRVAQAGLCLPPGTYIVVLERIRPISIGSLAPPEESGGDGRGVMLLL